MHAIGDPLLQAAALGLLSASALPLGALVVVFWMPPNRPLAAIMGFGAGALISALTIDLVAEAVGQGQFLPLAAGSVSGGVAFVVLNHLLNGRGGFLRKSSTTTRYLRRSKGRKLRALFQRLASIPFFRSLPPEEIATLAPSIHARGYQAGSTIIRQGEPGDSLFIVEQGSVDIMDYRRGEKLATLHAGDVFGEMALLNGAPRSATAVAAEPCRIWIVLKEDFDRLRATSPHLARAMATLAAEREEDLRSRAAIHADEEGGWLARAAQSAGNQSNAPTTTEIREAATEHRGAPLAIWLGTLLDGIPESVVIGASLAQGAVSLSLLAGVFLSNFPEALSSSAAMRHSGMRTARIVVLWLSLLGVSALGAVAGRAFLSGASPSVYAAIQGVGAGAMLVMIAETMLPEAYEKGGPVTGLATLLGFLGAVFFRTLA